jgi:hypothetical protein
MKLKPVLIPTTVENADLHSPVDRRICRQTLLLRVSIGRCLLPVDSLFKSRRLANISYGIRGGIDLRMKIQPSPYLNKELSFEYVREVLLPAVNATVSFQDVDENR